MSERRYGVAALATLLSTLAACGGESNPPVADVVTASSAGAIAESRITLDAYSASRTPSVPKALSSADALRATLALALPPLQDTLTTTSGQYPIALSAIVFPAIQAARLDVLRAATAGDTLAELEAALPSAVTLDATRTLLAGVSRKLWASASAQFTSSFLASTDTGGSSWSPWQAIRIQDWPAAFLELADFGSVSDLNLRPQTRLVIGHRFDAEALAGGQAVAFDGVGVRSPDNWYTAPMVAFEGPGGILQGDDYVAAATWIGDRLWVSLRPRGNTPLYRGLPPASLNSALNAAWSTYPAPEGLVSRSRQVWPQQMSTLEDRSRLPAGIALPYSEIRANLSGLDGGGTYLKETARAASLAIDTVGLRVSGAQAMAFSFSVDNTYGGGSYGSGSTLFNLAPFAVLPRCPRAEADWRGAYLALIDRSGRLLFVASLPDAPSAASACTPL